jgi:hypothetical protein
MADAIERRAPRFVKPVESTIFLVSVGLLSAVVLKFPDWNVWRDLTGGSYGEPLAQRTQLGSAIALLALLLFAANQLNSLEKDSKESPEYLGVNIMTYELNRSRTKAY